MLLGVAHAVYIYMNEMRTFQTAVVERPFKIRARAGYFALWTLLLWATLGASIVIYWLIAVVLYAISRAWPKASRG